MLHLLRGVAVAEDAIEEAADRIERVLPRVAGILRVALQEPERHRFIFERAGEPRRIGERRLFIEEARDLEIGVDARLELAEELQEEALAVNDRGIALLRLEHLRVERLGAAQFAERARRNAGELPVFAAPGDD